MSETNLSVVEHQQLQQSAPDAQTLPAMRVQSPTELEKNNNSLYLTTAIYCLKVWFKLTANVPVTTS